MRSQRVAQAIQSEEVEQMNMEERVGRLEVKVDHIQSDVTEVKTDVRELRGEMQTQGKELRAEMSALGADINTLKVGFEKMRGQVWVALAACRTELSNRRISERAEWVFPCGCGSERLI